KSMMDVTEVYGLIVVDRREGNIGYLKGTQIQEVASMTSGVPGKTRAGGQCMHPDTAVTLADGQYVRIAELMEGDDVMSYDFATKEFVPSKVKKVWTTTKDKLYTIKTLEDELQCSADHMLFLSDGMEVAAENLKKDMLLIDENGNPKKVVSVAAEDRHLDLVDIEVEKGNFIAEGIVVHNSAQRFARLRQEAAKEFFRRISEVAQKEFLGKKELKGILLGGPGPTKEIYLATGELNNELKLKIITIQDLSYTGEFGLRELVEKSREALAKEAITEEKDIMEKFFKGLATSSNMVAYGKKEVEKAMELKAVDCLLLSEDLDPDYSEAMEAKADDMGTKVQIISVDTPEGMQLRDLGGIAAFLRYPLE
ncbi:MAG: hypothetical protein AABY09_03195, partial [Nanoarchaeota archaeon]